MFSIGIIKSSKSLESYLPNDPSHEEEWQNVYARPGIPLPPPPEHRPALSYGSSLGYVYAQNQGRPRPRPYTKSPAYLTTIDYNSTRKPQDIPFETDPRDPDGDSIIGVAHEDYPILHEIPKTSFQCSDKPNAGYFADPETRCQVSDYK